MYFRTPIILLLLVSSGIFAQDDCSDGSAHARADVKAGNLKKLAGGAPKSGNNKHSFHRHTYNEILQEFYGVSTEYKGEEFSPYFISCYNAYMDSALAKRFGKDFETSCRGRLDSMNMIEQKNALAFYGNWDGLMDALMKDSLNNSILGCDRGKDTIKFDVEIDATGLVKNIVANSNGFCNGFVTKLIAHIKYVKWTPAVGICGKKQPTKGTLTFIFNNHQFSYFDAGFY